MSEELHSGLPIKVGDTFILLRDVPGMQVGTAVEVQAIDDRTADLRSSYGLRCTVSFGLLRYNFARPRRAESIGAETKPVQAVETKPRGFCVRAVGRETIFWNQERNWRYGRDCATVFDSREEAKEVVDRIGTDVAEVVPAPPEAMAAARKRETVPPEAATDPRDAEIERLKGELRRAKSNVWCPYREEWAPIEDFALFDRAETTELLNVCKKLGLVENGELLISSLIAKLPQRVSVSTDDPSPNAVALSQQLARVQLENSDLRQQVERWLAERNALVSTVAELRDRVGSLEQVEAHRDRLIADVQFLTRELRRHDPRIVEVREREKIRKAGG